MNNLIQNEIFHYAKICGERLFHNFWITVLKKVKIWNQGSLCPLLLCVLLRSFPRNYSWKEVVPKIGKAPWQTPRSVSVLAAGQRPSYVQRVNCAPCYPCNFEAVYLSEYLWLIFVIWLLPTLQKYSVVYFAVHIALIWEGGVLFHSVKFRKVVFSCYYNIWGL